MAILNYTTAITAEKTASEIQKKLAMAGAKAVLSEYDDDGVMYAMSFRIGVLTFLLPINIDGAHIVLRKNPKVPKRLKTREQAARVAWRIIKDWVEAQIAIIELGQAELPQIFLAYAQDKTGKTIYEAMKQNKFKLLTVDREV